MQTLSKAGRTEICKRFGIKNKSSIFVQNSKAFNDRMELLNRTNNVQKAIDKYLEYISGSKSESYYLSEIEKDEQAVYDDISDNWYRAIDARMKLFKKPAKHCNMKYGRPILDDLTVLKIYSKTPMFDAYRFRVSEIIPEIMELDDLHDYIMMLTENEYLATVMKDLDISRLNGDIAEDIKMSSNDLATMIFSEVSPKFLNRNTLTYIGYGEVQYVVAKHISPVTVDKIIKDVREFNESFRNAEIEIYDNLIISEDHRIQIEVPMIADENGLPYRLSGGNSTENIAYLRNITNTEPSVYDTYFEYNGKQAKVFENPSLDWEQIGVKLKQLSN
jgi:hypothetical protein